MLHSLRMMCVFLVCSGGYPVDEGCRLGLFRVCIIIVHMRQAGPDPERDSIDDIGWSSRIISVYNKV